MGTKEEYEARARGARGPQAEHHKKKFDYLHLSGHPSSSMVRPIATLGVELKHCGAHRVNVMAPAAAAESISRNRMVSGRFMVVQATM